MQRLRSRKCCKPDPCCETAPVEPVATACCKKRVGVVAKLKARKCCKPNPC
jgi:hypothetical protein